MATERLGLTVIPGAGWRAADVRTVAREAEQAGFEAMFSTEVNSDSMATAQVMGSATERLTVGTWVANIYLRHSYVCAKGAELIADDTGGRFVLGLGVSHRPVNDALQIDMTNAAHDIVDYARAVRDWLEGRGPTTHLPQSPAPHRVPVHVAALGLVAVERAAEVADGLMPTMWSPQRVEKSAEYIARGRARSPELGPLELTLGLPTFIGDDLDQLHAIARENLALYTGFPFFRRMWRESGFIDEADAMERGAGSAGLSDELLDSFCLIGPLSRCRERLASYRAAGVDLPILNPPVGPRAAREVVHAFGGS
jgi:alkanesulfonate monooxygenase SsuD/methylene tetrahydromethanopterin reductase-like flavin-dependent oxidoreductase (luciferase family)